MKHVPTEIWNEIFSHLYQSDLATCVRVCSHWNQIIEDHTLYHTVCLYSSSSLKKLTKNIQENSKIARKINNVALYVGPSFNTISLVTFLSSLKHVRKLLFHDNFHSRYCMSQIQYQFHNDIEYISEYSEYLTNGILSTGFCPMLTTLEIHNLAFHTIPLLKNAPALKRLSLCPGHISFSSLNTIHASITGLESLEIRDSSIEDLGFDTNIEPATFIVEVIFLDVSLTVPKIMWEYIYQKYPNASSIACSCYELLSSAKVFDQGIYDGWMKLFQGLGNRLKRICHFDEVDNKGLFEALDKYNCGLSYLQLYHFQQHSLQKIAFSAQVHCLETLVLCDAHIESYEWLNHLQALRKLKLISPINGHEMMAPILDLTDVLDNCPSQLTSLSLDSVTISDDIQSSTPTNITDLCFRIATLPANIDSYIAIHFPKLSKLKLKSCGLYKRKFDLSQLDLNAFHYNDFYFASGQLTGDCKVLISTLDNLEQRLYQFKAVNDVGTDKPLKAVPEYSKTSPMHETDDTPTFTLLCYSLGKFSSV